MVKPDSKSTSCDRNLAWYLIFFLKQIIVSRICSSLVAYSMSVLCWNIWSAPSTARGRINTNRLSFFYRLLGLRAITRRPLQISQRENVNFNSCYAISRSPWMQQYLGVNEWLVRSKKYFASLLFYNGKCTYTYVWIATTTLMSIINSCLENYTANLS